MQLQIWLSGGLLVGLSWFAHEHLERDIRSLYDIGNLREFERFLQLLAARCAQVLNMSSLASETGVAVNTIKRWISILEACRIIYLLPPYYNNLGKRITKAPKVYSRVLANQLRRGVLNPPVERAKLEPALCRQVREIGIRHFLRDLRFRVQGSQVV
jgi:hypothetical protein